MQAKLKLIFYYLIEFVLSLLVLALALLMIFKITLLNPKYILRQFEKNNYYEELYQNIETEMTYYVDQSGLEESVVTGVIDKNIIEDEVKGLIMSLYTGDKVTITTENLKNSIRNNIEEYLKVNNLTAKEEDIELFLKEMEDVYINKITLNNKLNSVSKALVKINDLLVKGIIGLTIVGVVIYIVSKFITRKYLLPVPLMTSAFLIFLGNFLLHSKISIKYISFWNDSVSKVLKSIISNISLQSIIWAIVLILLSFGLIFVKVLNKKRASK